jgi:hypothetical protein
VADKLDQRPEKGTKLTFYASKVSAKKTLSQHFAASIQLHVHYVQILPNIMFSTVKDTSTYHYKQVSHHNLSFDKPRKVHDWKSYDRSRIS